MSSFSASTSSSVSSLTPRSCLDLLDRLLELLAGDAARDVAEHLHEAPVGVPGEALVVGGAGQPLDRRVVETEVEHGVEHPGHRLARPAPDRDQQRVLVVAELLAGVLLQPLERLLDLLGHPLGLLLARLHVGHARLGGDGEARGDLVGAEDAGHLRDVGALATEQLAHVLRALGEVVHPLLVAHLPRSYPGPGGPCTVRRSGQGTNDEHAAPADGRGAYRQRAAPTGRSRTCAWYSRVSRIARSACASARGGASGASARGRPRARHEEVVGLLVEGERVRLAGRAHDSPGGAGEADEVLRGRRTRRRRPAAARSPPPAAA